MSASLPSGFEVLEPFVDSWAIDGAINRARRRSASNEQEQIAFYSVAKDLLDPALTYLDQRSLNSFTDQEQRLMNLVLSFAHIAQAVEVQQSNEAAHAKLRESLTITCASADSLG